MNIFQPKLVLVAALTTLGSLALISACGGAEFRADGAGGDGGSSSAGSSSAGTAGGGQAMPCSAPRDCDDGDACTTDFCTVQGSCQAAPRCTGSDLCCDGDCQQCCQDADCDDGIACTANTCFAGRCMFSPDDGQCSPAEACSVTEGCKAKIACSVTLPGDVSCTDSSACTQDSCENGFCANKYCAPGTVCCADGCKSECCDDSQCRSEDPCSVGSCGEDGKCQLVPLCGSGEKCCANADGETASCGTCCSAQECDDGVACTKDSCTGVRLSCSNKPDNSACTVAGQTCSPSGGCVRPEQCDDAGDCTADSCGRCDQGVCKYDCPNDQPCCTNTNTCAACCSDAACDDGIACTTDACGAAGCTHTPNDRACQVGYQCLPKFGGCVQCTSDANCDDGNTCTTDTCDLSSHTCSHVGACECKTGFDCQGVIAQEAQRPMIPGDWVYCHSCVDGKCMQVACYGQCCSSGCFNTGLCPD